MRYLISVVLFALLSIGANPALAKGAVFEVVLDNWIDASDVQGRVVVFLIKNDTGISRHTRPAEGPFLSSPQPIYALDMSDQGAWHARRALLDDSADWVHTKPSDLEPGTYRAQAIIDRRQWDSAWYREPGNWFSDPYEFRIEKDADEPRKVQLVIDEPVNDRGPVAGRIFKTVEIRSDLLSSFFRVEAAIRAAIVLPINYDPDRKYPAVYIVPGFGADDTRAYNQLTRREHDGLVPGERELHENAVLVYLNPEGPNGHHLFMNSENNGPLENALVKELIPAVEAEMNLIAEPSARIITGHSSGGWSATWLTLHNPNTFGACWATAPDPVDFRAFQRINIYEHTNMYELDGAEIVSRDNGKNPDLTVRMENQIEELLGPGGTSSQQWDSWQAVFGPRVSEADPSVRPLFDAETGEIDSEVAAHFRKFDISALTRANPAWYAKLFKNRVRIVAAEDDEYALGDGVKLLKQAVEEAGGSGGPGYIKVLAGTNHSSVRDTREARAFPQEMLDYFKEHGHIPAD